MTTNSLPQSMRCFSVCTPWSWYLMFGGKNIENRAKNFPRNFRGRVLIQASKTWNKEDVLLDMEYANKIWEINRFLAEGAPDLTLEYLYETRGHALGTIEIIDYITESESPWFDGPVGVVVRNPIMFAKPVPMRGMLGLFTVDVSAPEFQEQLKPAFSRAA